LSCYFIDKNKIYATFIINVVGYTSDADKDDDNDDDDDDDDNHRPKSEF